MSDHAIQESGIIDVLLGSVSFPTISVLLLHLLINECGRARYEISTNPEFERVSAFIERSLFFFVFELE